MQNKITLDHSPYSINSNHLPLLIHGKDKSGASFFTITAMVDLFFRGAKLLFLSAHQPAKDKFVQDVQEKSQNFTFIKSIDELQNASTKQAIILQEADSQLFTRLVAQLPDIHERICVIKNIEEFDSSVFNSIKAFPKIIISGDIDKSSYAEDILKQHFPTSIVFSPLSHKPELNPPQLEQYQGYLWHNERKGIIKVTI